MKKLKIGEILLEQGVISEAELVNALELQQTALAEVYEKNHQLSTAMDNLKNGVVISDMRLSGNPVIYVNKAFTTITEYESTEVLGKNCRFLQGEESSIYAVMRVKEAIQLNEALTVEIINYKKSGQKFWNELALSPIFDEKNILIYYVGLVHDISHRKSLEESLVNKEKLLRAVAQVNNILLVQKNLDASIEKALEILGVITEVSRVTICKENVELASNKAAREKLYEWKNEDVFQLVILSELKVPILVDGELWGFVTFEDYRYEKKWSETENIILESTAAGIGAAIKRHQVYEETKIAHEVAEKATRAKSDFLAHMSHEIRTPMNIILGMSELLIGTTLSEEQQQYIEFFIRSGKQLMESIDGILDLSKIESKQMELEPKLFNFKLFVHDLSLLFAVHNENKNVKLMYDFDDLLPPWVYGDENRIRQIAVNLIGNALKFTPKGSVKVVVFGEERGHNKFVLHLRVIDNGIGIPKDKIDSIFNSFTQVDNSITKKYGGSGLGLTITKEFVSLMNGTIEVVSELGKGTEFHVAIPLLFQTKNEGSEMSSQLTSGTSETTITTSNENTITNTNESNTQLKDQKLMDATLEKRLLLVDDSSDNRVLIKIFLNKHNIHIDEASNGVEAVQLFEKNSYDLILMDVQMPIMDGYEAVTQIREREKQTNKKPVSIIALTAYAYEKDVQKSLDVGCNGHLSKPVERKLLISTVESFMKEID